MNNGEDAWGDLSPDYALCDAGTQQSPIDIAYTKIEKLPALKPDYRLSDAHIVRRDFTLVTNIDGNNTLTDDKNIYPLAQIRLHMPGEHHIHAAWWPLEIQLIHRDANNKILILSVLAQYGGANPALQSIIDHAQSGSARLDPMGLLPAKLGYYAYTGSLTSPPCTEGVEWRVLKQPITFSKQQALALSQFFGRNARLPQPVYMRVVRESKDK